MFARPALDREALAAAARKEPLLFLWPEYCLPDTDLPQPNLQDWPETCVALRLLRAFFLVDSDDRMNPLTQIKNTQKASQREIAQGVGDSASWHAKFKHSAYIFTGGLSYDLTEGDLLAVFAQYGEIVDVNLVRDKDTGQPFHFALIGHPPPPPALRCNPHLKAASRGSICDPLHAEKVLTTVLEATATCGAPRRVTPGQNAYAGA